MSKRDLRMEVSEQGGDWGLGEISHNFALASVGVLVALKNKHVLLDQMPEVLLL